MLKDEPALTRAGWTLARCVFASPTDRRTLEVKMVGPGSRTNRLRAPASAYIAPNTEPGYAPKEHHRVIPSDLAQEVVEAACSRTAATADWVDFR